jgi:hypothetical protein
MYRTVVSVEVLPPKSLAVRFADGAEGRVRFESTHLNGVFAALKDPAVFEQVHIECGAVTGPGDTDLAPDAMYREIKKDGEWILK